MLTNDLNLIRNSHIAVSENDYINPSEFNPYSTDEAVFLTKHTWEFQLQWQRINCKGHNIENIEEGSVRWRKV